jgi:hypothetical protein
MTRIADILTLPRRVNSPYESVSMSLPFTRPMPNSAREGIRQHGVKVRWMELGQVRRSGVLTYQLEDDISKVRQEGAQGKPVFEPKLAAGTTSRNKSEDGGDNTSRTHDDRKDE